MMVLSLRHFRLASALLLTSLAAPALFAQASTWVIDPAHSGVEFSIKHLGVSTVRGSMSGVTGTVVWDEKNVGASHVEAVIDTKTVTTGQDARDQHLKSAEFFDVNQYPTMTFKSTSVTRNKGNQLEIIGDLKLGGQTKPVTLHVDGPAAPQKGMNGKLVSGFSATGLLSRKNFNFGQKYGEPLLGDEVRFTIDLEVGLQ